MILTIDLLLAKVFIVDNASVVKEVKITYFEKESE